MTWKARARDTRALQLDVLSWLGRSDSQAPTLFSVWRELDYKYNGRSVMPDKAAAEWTREVANTLRDAALWYITADMATAIREASFTMPMNALLESDFPSRKGWLVFETPQDFQAVDGVDVSTRAILWDVRKAVGKVGEVQGSGAAMFEWTDHEKVVVEDPEMAALIGDCPLFPATLGSLHYGRVPWVPLMMPNAFSLWSPRLGVMQDPDIREVMTKFYAGRLDQEKAPIPPNATITRDGSKDGTLVYDYTTVSGTSVRLQPDPAWRFLAALFWMLQDRKSRTMVEQRLDTKVERKRMKKRGVKPSPITLIYWRKLLATRIEHGGTPTGRTLHHRFVRDGHWRNQWFPSEGRHKPLYIWPTVVGDDSLPWLEKKPRVNVVRR